MKTQKGITLIALIITIIVMLILVGVSISVALNTGLFKAAQGAAQNTETEKILENELSTGKVTIGETSYNSLEDYIAGVAVLPNGITKVVEENIPSGWDTAKVTPITDGIDTIPLPKGFRILEVAGKETTVEEGIVIKDNNLGNEFVWVPVDNSASYTEDSFGPITETYSPSGAEFDSQTTLDYLYGTNYYNYANDFDYANDKENVEKSIRTYGGFYVGRYETTYDTIDETTGVVSGMGVKPGKNVLRANSLLKSGTNSPVDSNDKKSNESYYYRWWGIYKAQKDMYKNNQNVGSLMISSKQWDAIMTHTGYSGATRDTNTYKEEGKPDLSGSAYKDSNPAEYDETHNIFDLAGNLHEWGMDVKGDPPYDRVDRGGHIWGGVTAERGSMQNPISTDLPIGSRTCLYIK